MSETPPPPPPSREPSPEGSEASPRRRKRRNPWIPFTLAAILIVALGAAAYFLLAGSDDASGEVILQSTSDNGSDPFTDSVANMKVDELTSGGDDIAGEPVPGIEGGDSSVESVDGSAPGLYGGSEQEQICDPDAMVAFLEDNPDKAQAWADAQGIAVEDIPDYVATLTPVILREDTRVTNNGFIDGQASPFQAVLQAGTAVLVDDRGVPRVRCACGNPLSEPEATETKPEYTGTQWAKFDDNRIVNVLPSSETIDRFRLVDVETGEEFDQDAGSGGDVRDLVFELGGVGNLKIGMTEEEAEQATGLEVDFESQRPGGCAIVTFPELGDSLRGIAADGLTIGGLSSYDPRASTSEGVTVGSTEADVENAYPGGVQREPFVGKTVHLYVESGPEDDIFLRFDAGTDGVFQIDTGRPLDLNLQNCF